MSLKKELIRVNSGTVSILLGVTAGVGILWEDSPEVGWKDNLKNQYGLCMKHIEANLVLVPALTLICYVTVVRFLTPSEHQLSSLGR